MATARYFPGLMVYKELYLRSKDLRCYVSPNKNRDIAPSSHNSAYQTTGQYIYKCESIAHFPTIIHQISTLFVEVSHFFVEVSCIFVEVSCIFVEISHISVEVPHIFLYFGFHICRSLAHFFITFSINVHIQYKC
jgi:hypothetical protein